MASINEIQNRMKSIQDTMKITKAMYMMSSMKLRKAKQKLEDTEPYFYGLQEQIANILYHFPDMENRYFDNRNQDRMETVKKKGIIVMTGDKGMAGAYNHNLVKEAQRLCDESECYRLFVVGEVGRQYFKSQGYPVEEEFRFSTNRPSVHRARVITELIVELCKQDELDEVYVIYTRMINSMKEEVEIQQLLPLKTHEFLKQEKLEQLKKRQVMHNESLYEKDEEKGIDDGDFFIYPSPKKVLDSLVYNYVTGFLYGALVEASASEENARMLAMQAATDNAQEMLHDLSIQYNRVRQAAITQEITEVIGGAKALKKKKKKQVR
ncbi:MAG: ATP synthase F1 subunit gamma [Lachnospiraceae bacterium]|nr:ATP synthase F1 subunit gamma [Lachnospiraceae bacterium]